MILSRQVIRWITCRISFAAPLFVFSLFAASLFAASFYAAQASLTTLVSLSTPISLST